MKTETGYKIADVFMAIAIIYFFVCAYGHARSGNTDAAQAYVLTFIWMFMYYRSMMTAKRTNYRVQWLVHRIYDLEKRLILNESNTQACEEDGRDS